MLKPGPRNLITDVDGILVGNAEDQRVRSGVSVVLCDPPATASVDVRGGAPGTRETDLLDPMARVDRIDAICLSGGSAFGLSSADGVMRWLRDQGRGVAIGDIVVPIVPTAILSRQVGVVRKQALILNLPGQPKAIKETLDGVFAAVPYCIDLIGGPDRKSTRLNSSHSQQSRMPSSA